MADYREERRILNEHRRLRRIDHLKKTIKDPRLLKKKLDDLAKTFYSTDVRGK